MPNSKTLTMTIRTMDICLYSSYMVLFLTPGWLQDGFNRLITDLSCPKPRLSLIVLKAKPFSPSMLFKHFIVYLPTIQHNCYVRVQFTALILKALT